MDIRVQSATEIVIHGNIKSISDYQEIKKIVTGMLQEGIKELNVHMPESFSITSSIIGYFLKLVYQDSIKLRLLVSDERLMSLLADLRLTETFRVEQLSA